MNEPLLEIDQIQANIAPGFRFPSQHLIAIKAEELDAAKQLISSLLPQVTNMGEAIDFHEIRLAKASQSYTFSLESFDDLERKPVWLNLGLGVALLERAGIRSPISADRSFKLGLSARSFSLGDPRDSSHEGHKGNWLVGGPDNSADIFVILGSSDDQSLDRSVEGVIAESGRLGLEVLYQERGDRLDGDTEHFGFRDGVSQPGIRGLVSQNPRQYLTRRRVANSSSGPEWASPGKPLVWPGEFIFGYPKQNPNDFRNPLPVADVDSFLRNGSFLVFRRLKQDVKLFRDETARMAGELAATSEFSHMTPELFQASLVGRWPDGSPLVRHPNAPPASTPSEEEMNHFNFGSRLDDLTLVDGTTIPGVDGDLNGVKCPFHAHIRKINPRDRATDLGAETNTLKMRILRRGIPYGPPFEESPELSDRGLLFLCYQTSIRDQFEQITTDWVNSTVNPELGNNEGFDMILGQNGPTEDRQRFCVFQNAPGIQRSVASLHDWVIPTGGGYFFCPSLDALQQFAAP